MVENEDIITDLRQIIEKQLLPLIDNDYIYIDLPYYSNIGDSLIWQGTEDFLSNLPYRCISRSSCETFDLSRISHKTIIIMHGGGNFGDLYTRHQIFRKRIIETYPDNRIIILPQTVYYNGARMLVNDAITMRRHKDLHICVRDMYSYNFLKRYRFGRNILLVPDMAFCIDFDKLKDSILPQTEKILLFKRIDKEKADTSHIVPDEYHQMTDVLDWPGYETETPAFSKLKQLIKAQKYSEADIYAVKSYLPGRVADGIRMISPYKRVYSNRLHGSILSILLGKEVTIIDNSYGKNVQFYDTWLKDVPSIHINRVKHPKDLRRMLRMGIAWGLSQLRVKI